MIKLILTKQRKDFGISGLSSVNSKDVCEMGDVPSLAIHFTFEFYWDLGPISSISYSFILFFGQFVIWNDLIRK